MATGQGTVEIDFGAAPGSYEASVAVTGQASILTTSKAEAYIMADDTTADHTAVDHRWVKPASGVEFTCGTPTLATGFTIYGKSVYALEGLWKLRWVWAD